MSVLAINTSKNMSIPKSKGQRFYPNLKLQHLMAEKPPIFAHWPKFIWDQPLVLTQTDDGGFVSVVEDGAKLCYSYPDKLIKVSLDKGIMIFPPNTPLEDHFFQFKKEINKGSKVGWRTLARLAKHMFSPMVLRESKHHGGPASCNGSLFFISQADYETATSIINLNPKHFASFFGK